MELLVIFGLLLTGAFFGFLACWSFFATSRLRVTRAYVEGRLDERLAWAPQLEEAAKTTRDARLYLSNLAVLIREQVRNERAG